ncbi:MAG: RNA polymerase sigma factor [Chitinophagales bacterium]
MVNFEAWLKDFKAGNKQAVSVLYDEYRPVFVKWLSQQYRCGGEEAVDIFQDSVIALYKNAQRGKLDVLKSGLQTYLFAIGKNVYLNRLRSRKETVSESALSTMKTEEEGVERKLQMNDRKKLIAQLLNKMKDPCKSILYLFYYRRYSIEAIQKAMKYNTVEVVKTQKKRCIKGLEKRMAQVMKKGDI